MACAALGSRLTDIEDAIEAIVTGLAFDDAQRLILLNATCLAATQLQQFVIASGSSTGVTVLASNKKTLMPNGVLGIVMSKSSSTVCRVLIRGRLSGFTNLPTGDLFVSTTGGITNVAPSTGVVQCIGRRLSATELMFDPKQTLLRDADTP